MAGKKRLRMRGVKQTPKRLEEEILSRSEKLAGDPGILRPLCAGKCRKCAFDKTFKEINTISKYRGDEAALIKLASRGGDDIAKAFAGTISLAAAGKIPMLATATLAGEKVPFVVRGAVGNDKLIGCQYYNDPKIRLLLYNQFIKKNKLHLYSFNEGLVCSDCANMPEDYLYEAFWDTPYEFKDDSLQCGHDGLKLKIKIKSLDETIEICENCAQGISTVQFLISKLCAIDPLDDLEISVSHNYHTDGESGEEKIDGETRTKYLRGELNDKSLIAMVKKDKLGQLKNSDKSTYVIGVKNYGSDMESFVGDLAGPENEKNTLAKFLSETPTSMVLKNGKTSEAILSLWETNWREIISAHTSAEVASRYVNRPKSSYDLVLDEAYDIFVSADIVAALPVFKNPKRMTHMADTYAKAAKVNGISFVMKAVENEALKNSKERCLSAAFIFACDPNMKLPMNLSAEDKEFVTFLIPFVKNVIDASGEKYRGTMNTLLTACGSGESV